MLDRWVGDASELGAMQRLLEHASSGWKACAAIGLRVATEARLPEIGGGLSVALL